MKWIRQKVEPAQSKIQNKQANKKTLPTTTMLLRAAALTRFTCSNTSGGALVNKIHGFEYTAIYGNCNDNFCKPNNNSTKNYLYSINKQPCMQVHRVIKKPLPYLNMEKLKEPGPGLGCPHVMSKTKLRAKLAAPLFLGYRRNPKSPRRLSKSAEHWSKCSAIKVVSLMTAQNFREAPVPSKDVGEYDDLSKVMRGAAKGFVTGLDKLDPLFDQYKYNESESVLWLFDHLIIAGTIPDAKLIKHAMDIYVFHEDLDMAESHVFDGIMKIKDLDEYRMQKTLEFLLEAKNKVMKTQKKTDNLIEKEIWGFYEKHQKVKPTFGIFVQLAKASKTDLNLKKCLDILESDEFKKNCESITKHEEELYGKEDNSTINGKPQAKVVSISELTENSKIFDNQQYSCAHACMISAYGFALNLEMAANLFNSMENKLIRRPISVHNALLEAYVYNNQFDVAKAMFEDMKKNLIVDVETFNKMIPTCATSMEVEDMLYQLEKSPLPEVNNTFRNTETYFRVIDAFVRFEDFQNAAKYFMQLGKTKRLIKTENIDYVELFNRVDERFDELWQNHVLEHGSHGCIKKYTRGYWQYQGNKLRHKAKLEWRKRFLSGRKALPISKEWDRPRF